MALQPGEVLFLRYNIKQMKTVVYIDGQNFLYKAADVLIEAGKLKEKQDLHTFSFRTLIENLLDEKDLDIRFYGTRLKRYKSPPDIAKKSQIMVDSQRRCCVTEIYASTAANKMLTSRKKV